MNAKMGGNNNGYELVMGRHRVGSIDENGERFAAACADNNLVIGGSIFPSIKQLGFLLTIPQKI